MSSVLRPGMVRVISPVSGSATSQVEDQVLPGDLTQRLGPADVEGVLVAELAVELGAAGDGLFEVEGVGGVEGGGAVGDAVVAEWSRPRSTCRWSWALGVVPRLLRGRT